MRLILTITASLIVRFSTMAQPFLIEHDSLLPDPVGWVSDFESIISDADTKRLDSIFGAMDSIYSLEIAVITMSGMELESAHFDEYALKLANGWGVGKKNRDNGITVLVSQSLRKVRIQLGRGIERIISDDEAQLVIDSLMIPRFKAGDYSTAIEVGILELGRRIIEKDDGTLTE